MPFANLPRLFLALTAAYFFASLGHFSHNAQFICEYPNLPAWLTSAKVYAFGYAGGGHSDSVELRKEGARVFGDMKEPFSWLSR